MVSHFPEHKKRWCKEEEDSFNPHTASQHQRMQLNPNILNTLWDGNCIPSEDTRLFPPLHQERLLRATGGCKRPEGTFPHSFSSGHKANLTWGIDLTPAVQACGTQSLWSLRSLISEVFLVSLLLGWAPSWCLHSFLGLFLFLLTTGYYIACYCAPLIGDPWPAPQAS